MTDSLWLLIGWVCGFRRDVKVTVDTDNLRERLTMDQHLVFIILQPSVWRASRDCGFALFPRISLERGCLWVFFRKWHRSGNSSPCAIFLQSFALLSPPNFVISPALFCILSRC